MAVFDMIEGEGDRFEQRPFTAEAAEEASEAFLTSRQRTASRNPPGWPPVGDGNPGPLTRDCARRIWRMQRGRHDENFFFYGASTQSGSARRERSCSTGTIRSSIPGLPSPNPSMPVPRHRPAAMDPRRDSTAAPPRLREAVSAYFGERAKEARHIYLGPVPRKPSGTADADAGT